MESTSGQIIRWEFFLSSDLFPVYSSRSVVIILNKDIRDNENKRGWERLDLLTAASCRLGLKPSVQASQPLRLTHRGYCRNAGDARLLRQT